MIALILALLLFQVGASSPEKDTRHNSNSRCKSALFLVCFPLYYLQASVSL